MAAESHHTVPYYVPHTKVAKEDATLSFTSNLGFLHRQEPLVQKLIIVPLYIQCETAGGETQCAASSRSTIHDTCVAHFYNAPINEVHVPQN